MTNQTSKPASCDHALSTEYAARHSSQRLIRSECVKLDCGWDLEVYNITIGFLHRPNASCIPSVAATICGHSSNRNAIKPRSAVVRWCIAKHVIFDPTCIGAFRLVRRSDPGCLGCACDMSASLFCDASGGPAGVCTAGPQKQGSHAGSVCKPCEWSQFYARPCVCLRTVSPSFCLGIDDISRRVVQHFLLSHLVY